MMMMSRQVGGTSLGQNKQIKRRHKVVGSSKMLEVGGGQRVGTSDFSFPRFLFIYLFIYFLSSRASANGRGLVRNEK